MAKNVVINEVTYQNVPYVEIPLSGSAGNAEFYDTSDATLSSGDQMLDGYEEVARRLGEQQAPREAAQLICELLKK